MQAIVPQQPQKSSSLGRKIGYFLLPPLIALVLMTIILAVILGQYQAVHDGRILTGVFLNDIDLGGKTVAEAEVLLADQGKTAHAGHGQANEHAHDNPTNK